MAAQPKENWGFLVYDIARLLRDQFNNLALTLGLTQAQSRALVHLNRNEGVNQATLANILDIQPITLMRQLDKLEEKGLIERRQDSSDRRMQRLHLTNAARPLIDDLTQIGQTMTKDAFAGVNKETQKLVIETLLAVKDNLTSQVNRGAAE